MSSFDGDALLANVKAKAIARAEETGEALAELAEPAAESLGITVKLSARAMAGDKTSELALKALLSQAEFDAAAIGWLEVDAWVKAVIEAVEETAEAIVDHGMQLAAKAVASMIKGALEA